MKGRLIVAFSCLINLLIVVSGHNLPVLKASELFNVRNASDSRAGTCGYSSCPVTNPSKMNVHIVAHTHDDVGWLKTVDQYYYGTKKHYSQVGVQFILDSVVPQLVMDPTKRFVYVEMSFFNKWWREQDDQMKSLVTRLVNEGRLEFINGGWCMNDEATVTYSSTVEQMTLGLRFLNETFGQCAHPKVGWQIDPFGHTNEQASLFAQFGFDGMFFTRISYRDKEERIANKSLDLIWHGDRILSGQSGSIFTNIFRDGYDSPSGFCFDVLCMDDHLVDNEKSYEYNMKEKGENFLYYIRGYAKSKLTNNVLIPLGGDFQYSAAGQNFKNIDKLIRYVRNHAPEFNIFYSTPSCYQNAVHKATKDQKLKLPEKYDDFMPYDSGSSVWWSGYFSSRPSVKLVERETANLLQVSRLVSVFRLLKPQVNGTKWTNLVKEHENSCLLPLWEVLGDLQHHDAVTGTEKQHVADDYVRRAYDAWQQCSKFIGDIRRIKINEYLKKSHNYEHLRESGKKFKLDPVYLEDTMLCPLLNISQCDALEAEVNPHRFRNHLHLESAPKANSHIGMAHRIKRSGSTGGSNSANKLPPELVTRSVLMTVYNPMARPITGHDIRLPCCGRCDLEQIKVIHLSTNETMKLVRLPTPSGITSLPFRDSITSYEVLFYANLPALGHTSFVIEDTNNDEVVDEERELSETIIVGDDPEPQTRKALVSKRIRRETNYEYFTVNLGSTSELDSQASKRLKRSDTMGENSLSQNGPDKVIVKFDMSSGMIVGLKRISDGTTLNITQKFGYYFPADFGHPPGAYIFRPNTSEPHLFDKPSAYRIYKRKNGALIEIHQKWSNWLWQTIRIDARKNYIEFDYLVGPVPIIISPYVGREVVSRYITNMSNNGIFFTDSNGRQLLARHKKKIVEPEELGGSFYPVVSTIMLKNTGNTTRCPKCSAETVAILVDRAQAGTSLNEGQLELLVHRRQLRDDNFGVGEALDEPGEDGRGLVTRGKHRLYLNFHHAESPTSRDSGSIAVDENQSRRMRPQIFKLPETPRANLDFERSMAELLNNQNHTGNYPPTYIVHDQVLDDLRQASVKQAWQPLLTFDRLRVTASELVAMVASDGTLKVKTDLTLLNTSLPSNVHLLTFQPWARQANELLIRLENLNNPLTIHPYPNIEGYINLTRSYGASGGYYETEPNDSCTSGLRRVTEVNIEYLVKRIRIVELEELTLGANLRLKDNKRINWTDEAYNLADCDLDAKPTSIKLAPRQIRTFFARFEFL